MTSPISAAALVLASLADPPGGEGTASAIVRHLDTLARDIERSALGGERDPAWSRRRIEIALRRASRGLNEEWADHLLAADAQLVGNKFAEAARLLRAALIELQNDAPRRCPPDPATSAQPSATGELRSATAGSRRATVGSRRRVALVGTYPPTHCGLATFTSNLRAAIAAPGTGWDADVVRVLDHDEPESAPEVVGHWLTGDRRSLSRAREQLGAYDAVLLQHEYGLFGGADGEDVVALVDGLRGRLVAVLHTALRTPTDHQREVLDRVTGAAAAVVVQSEAARRRILAVHTIAPERVLAIPHGAAANFAVAGRRDGRAPTVLTWGLLGPGKGIEHGIDAVSRLGHNSAPPVYVVAGQTHPKVHAAHGEDYRETLRDRARSLGVADRVEFDDGYRDWDSLRALVRSADVVLLPYESRDQVSSGVLVEAIASGKPVVATRFPHAEELLSDGAGLLVDHGDVDAMAAALHRVLYEPGLADRMAAASRQAARPLLWPAVGAAYRTLIDAVIDAQAVA